MFVAAADTPDLQQLLAVLKEIRDALAPGPLEWIGSVGVPLLVGGFAVGVAMYSNRTARAGNEIAKQIHQERVATEARRLRRPYAEALSERVQLEAARKMLGLQKLNGPTQEQNAEFHRLQAACDDARAKEIERWAMHEISRATVTDDDKGHAFIQLAKRLEDRIELWATDPDLAAAAQHRELYMQALKDKIDQLQ